MSLVIWKAAVYTLEGYTPEINETAWIAPNSVVIGRVHMGAQSSVWFNVTIRGDIDSISIGERTNIQDGTVIHVDEGFPTTIGSNVVVGHNVVLHGCTVEDEALIGIGAIVLNGAIIRKGAQVGAGALVPPGMEVPEGAMVMGIPAKIKRILDLAERKAILVNADHYVKNAERYRNGLTAI